MLELKTKIATAVSNRDVKQHQPGLVGKVRHSRLGVVAFAVTLLAMVPQKPAAAPLQDSVWLIDGRVAVQIFDCGGQLCGRILWLAIPRDPEGQLNRDRYNPDPALRQRQLCGLTILWGLHAAAVDRWAGGWFYNPEDGKTYRVSAVQSSANSIMARIYEGLPLFGKTKILLRVSHGTSDGWC